MRCNNTTEQRDSQNILLWNLLRPNRRSFVNVWPRATSCICFVCTAVTINNKTTIFTHIPYYKTSNSVYSIEIKTLLEKAGQQPENVTLGVSFSWLAERVEQRREHLCCTRRFHRNYIQFVVNKFDICVYLRELYNNPVLLKLFNRFDLAVRCGVINKS